MKLLQSLGMMQSATTEWPLPSSVCITETRLEWLGVVNLVPKIVWETSKERGQANQPLSAALHVSFCFSSISHTSISQGPQAEEELKVHLQWQTHDTSIMISNDHVTYEKMICKCASDKLLQSHFPALKPPETTCSNSLQNLESPWASRNHPEWDATHFRADPTTCLMTFAVPVAFDVHFWDLSLIVVLGSGSANWRMVISMSSHDS